MKKNNKIATKAIKDQNSHFVKIKTVDGMTVYTPKVDIREVCVVPCYNTQDPAKQTKKNISYFINYTTIQGDSLLDKTPYKTHSMAEKVADTIINTLPAPKPITTIQQAPIEAEQPVLSADANGYQIPVGFRNYEDEYED